MKKLPTISPALHALRRSANLALVAGSVALLAGCAAGERTLASLPPPDATTVPKLTETLARESAQLAAATQAMQTQIEQRLRAPEPQPVAPRHDPLEDIVVSVKLQNASLPALLQVLAQQARLNLLVDPEVVANDKRASLYLNNVSARELYRHIIDAFDVHGTTDGNTIKVGMFEDRFFDIDFLNSRMNVDITAGGNVFGSSGGAGGSSSSGSGSGNGDQIRGNLSLTGGSGKQTEPYDQLDINLKRILNTGDTAAGGGVAPGASGLNDEVAREEEARKRPLFTLNRSSGTLFVRARPSQMRTVEKLVERYKAVLHRQVLIEAQLLDVELNDSFQYGVDWSLLRRHVAGAVGNSALVANSVSATLPNDVAALARTLTLPAITAGATAGASGAGLIYGNNNLLAALSLLRNFGNVKVLSNPSIRVRNNSPALLTVGTSTRIISKSAVTITNPGGGAATTTADVQTDSVFSGVVIGVVPFIGDKGQVDLLVHPMQTEVDPASLLLQTVGGGNQVTLPKISFKGMTTTLNIKDGDTIIMGGLIDQNSATNDSGVPGASDIPLFGKAFGKQSASNRSRELIMVLKVKVL
jgi:MSHA type pilus biogenesis protein MshL